MSEEYRRIGTLAEIPEGEVRGYELPAIRLSHGAPFSPSNLFTRPSTSAGFGASVYFFSICPARLNTKTMGTVSHDASAFDVRTGEPVRGVAVDPVPVFRVRIEDGWVAVALAGARAE